VSVSKKKRTHKVSKGERRSSLPISQSVVELALAGKGLVAAMVHVPCKVAWRGVGELRGVPFDAQQAALNRKLYPHLFPEDRKRETRETVR
jgi:hypothetical protein